MSFELLKTKATEGTYGLHIARVVLSLLRHLNDNDNDHDMEFWEELGCSGPIREDTDDDDLDDEDLIAHQGEVFALAELYGDDEDEYVDELFDGDGIGTDPDVQSESEDSDSDSDAEPIHGSDSETECSRRSYPILLTEEQKNALTNLDDALRSNASQDSLLALLHSVSLALCTTEPLDPEKHRFYHPIEFFIMASNLKQDGSFKKPVSIAPNLTILQYWIQFTILRDAVKSPEPTSEYVSHIYLFFRP